VGSLLKFLGVFGVTQVPLAVSEGILTVIVFDLLAQYNREAPAEPGVLPPGRATAWSAPDTTPCRAVIASRRLCPGKGPPPLPSGLQWEDGS
jgi:hypothetical protein